MSYIESCQTVNKQCKHLSHCFFWGKILQDVAVVCRNILVMHLLRIKKALKQDTYFQITSVNICNSDSGKQKTFFLPSRMIFVLSFNSIVTTILLY